MGTLEGKVAIVTGAGRGIGRGEALALAREGAAVVVNDVGVALDGSSEGHSPADAVVAEIEAAGGTAMANHADVASFPSAAGLVHDTVERFGRLDILVNNAGVLRDSMSFSMSEDDWDAVIRVHLKGHFAPSKFAAAHWRDVAKAGGDSTGRIVNTVSEAGLYGQAGQANYTAAKAGIAGMTIGLAREVKKYGVTVNAVAPRARTRMTDTVLGDFGAPPAEGFDEWDPENIGPVVAWLAGPDAAKVNGQVLIVFGAHVYRMRGWELVGEIDQDHRWTVAELTARADDLFGDDWRGVPRLGFGR